MSDHRYDFVVDAAQDGQRLDRFLASMLDNLSRSQIKHLIAQGHARIGAATIREAGKRVKSGHSVDLTVPPAQAATPQAQALPLQILYEDEDLIVVVKPAGLVVHPAAGNPDRTLVNALLAHCGDTLSGIGGVLRPGIVHRLDKQTSGIMVAAKHDRAHRGLATQFAAHSIDRAYHALVWGAPAPQGRIEGLIGRDPHHRQRMAVVARGGKQAVTHFTCETRFGREAALLLCRLETGRTHQIRVHLKHLGHPVIGDAVYCRPRRIAKNIRIAPAAQEIEQFPRQALHACRLGFTHPLQQRRLNFTAQMPHDMEHLAQALAHQYG